jgi:hypothetical protein
VSAKANGVIIKATIVGIKNWFQERTIALVLLHAGEQALVFFSQRHDDRQAQYKKNAKAKNAVKAAALALLAVVAVSTKSLKLLGTLHSENL